MYKTLHKKQGSVTVQLRFARSSVTFCAKRDISLKLDVVKFDRSLLLMADQDANSRFMLDYFSTAFERLGYKVLYEGVETDAQEELCIISHADYLQGYKFSKPIPIEELPRFLTRG